VKTKYFRVTFQKRVLFGPKPLKYSIEFYYEFCEKMVSNITWMDSKLKTESKIFDT
jgi:hypothetical protein